MKDQRNPTRRVIVVAASPRTGSTLLCRALAQVEGGGDPQEYLNPLLLGDDLTRPGLFDVTARGNLGRVWRRVRGDDDWRRVTLKFVSRRGMRRILERMAAEHTDAAGVFSVKLMWSDHEHVLRHGFDASFWGAPVTWVWIRRADHVRQAVSWARADQTGAWRSDREQMRAPEYDGASIERELRRSVEFESAWRAFFVRSGIEPFEVVYEDLDDHYERTMQEVFAHLGLAAARVPERPTKRQADALNDEWVERFLADRRAGEESTHEPHVRPATRAARPRTALDRVRGLLRLTSSAWRPGVRDVWIGDSHTPFISAECLAPKGSRTAEGDGVSLWLGPQLAFNFRAADLRAEDAFVIRTSSIDHGVFVMGEIDVRVHLGVDRSKRTLDWVESYVEQTQQAARRLGCTRSVLVGPIPPAAMAAADPEFPFRGPLEQRVEATAWLQDALETAAGRRGIPTVSPSALLADGAGILRREYGRDGVHVNALGAAIIRAEVAEQW